MLLLKSTSVCSDTTPPSRTNPAALEYVALFSQRKGIFIFSVVQLLSPVWLSVTSGTAAHQASLSFTISWSLHKYMSIKSVTLSNHLILCHPLLFLPSIFPSIRVFSNESVLHIRWPKYWSFSFSISPSNEYSGLISFSIDWFDLLLSKRLSRVFSSTTIRKHQFFLALSLLLRLHIYIREYCPA